MTKLLEQRASIRKYKTTPVDINQILQLLDAARLAQSAMNQQTWEFIWITDPTIRNELYETCVSQVRGKMEYLKESAGIIAAVCRPADSERWARLNVAIALENVAIAAVTMGLGTCWIGAYDPAKVGKILDVPADHEVVSLMVVGWPAEDPPKKDRKTLEEISFKDKYGQPLIQK